MNAIAKDFMDNYDEDIPVVITDAVTGNRAWGVHFVAEEYEGELLVNICDYEYDSGLGQILKRRSSVQTAELKIVDGKLVSLRDEAFDFFLPELTD